MRFAFADANTPTRQHANTCKPGPGARTAAILYNYMYTNHIRGIDAEVRLQNDANRFEPAGAGAGDAPVAAASQACKEAAVVGGSCTAASVLAGLEAGCSRDQMRVMCG